MLSYLIGPMFDEVFLNANYAALYFLGIGVLFVFAVRGTSGFVQRVVMTSVGERVKLELQRDLMRHVLTLDTMFFEANPPGNLMERVIGDAGTIRSVWSGLLAPAIRDVISLISLLIVSMSIDIVWTLLALAGIPILVFPVLFVQRLTRRSSLRERNTASAITVRLDEIFHGIHAIKLNIQENLQVGRFLNAARDNRRAAVRTEAGRASVPALVDIVAGMGFLGILILGGHEVIEGEKTIGQFMSFFTATVLLFDPLKRLGQIAAAWQVLKVSLERVHVLIEASPSIQNPAKPVPPPADVSHSDIVFENVDFEFDDYPVLRNLSFRIRSGKMTALVGPSGTGKTTVFNLITRILDPKSGRITIGGQDIRELDLESWIWWVSEVFSRLSPKIPAYSTKRFGTISRSEIRTPRKRSWSGPLTEPL